MYFLTREKRIQVTHLLCEGMSIRSISRVTKVSKGAILRLLVSLGDVCGDYHDDHVRGVKARRVQCDEIWSFVGMKDKTVLPDEAGEFGIGSVWTWTGIDADTKLMIAYHIGTRDAACAYEFMSDLKDRLANRVQLTTDGHKAYLSAVADTFGGGVDYAQLVKLYGKPAEGPNRYSPPACVGANLTPRIGNPELEHVSTSYVERANLTMRMQMRRYTRLTNGFSKKIVNLEHMVALYFMFYNFCRVHMSLRVTPAMEAGLTDHVWEISELIDLLPKPVRAPYGSKKRAAQAA